MKVILFSAEYEKIGAFATNIYAVYGFCRNISHVSQRVKAKKERLFVYE